MPPAAFLVVDELGRRGNDLVGPDWPIAIVHIELGNGVGEVEISFEIGVERTDVAPIFLDLFRGADAAVGKAMGHAMAVFDDIGDYVSAEVPL